MGFAFDAPLSHILLGVLLLMLMLGYAFSWVFAYIGMVSSTPRQRTRFGFMTIFPLTFISSAFVPVESMPAALEAFAEVNPFTTMVDAMRHLWQGAPANTDVWVAFLVDDRITIVFFFISTAKYKRATAK